MNIIKPQSGQIFTIKKGESIKITDIEGEQVADFWAFNTNNDGEFMSPGVSIDCNNKLLISTGDVLYSNLYNPLLEIIEDTTGSHSLIYPCCRQEMYDSFYDSKGKIHPNCFRNMNDSLQHLGKKVWKEIHPFNIFMNVIIQTSGRVSVQKPITTAGDHIIMRSLVENITMLITSCSVDSGNCNGGRCSTIGVEIIS